MSRPQAGQIYKQYVHQSPHNNHEQVGTDTYYLLYPWRGIWCADLFAELVGEGDEHPPVALPLVRGEGQDARQVVPEVRVLLLAEVSHGVEPEAVHLERGKRARGEIKTTVTPHENAVGLTVR